MKIELLAAGTRPPDWLKDGVAEYQKRLPKNLGFSIREVAVAKRGRGQKIEQLKQEEEKIFLQYRKQGARLIALDEGGTAWSTRDLAGRLESWMLEAQDVQLMVGGPDGLTPHLINEAAETWSLSRLTLPHFMVRLVVVEQLYRAISLLNNHPYHR